MRVLICGSRDYDNQAWIAVRLLSLNKRGYDTLIEGEAKGADTLAKKAAKVLGMWVMAFPAEWDKYGKAAGLIRNKQMLKEGCPNLVMAFYTDYSKSRGTRDMVRQAKKSLIPCIEYEGIELLEMGNDNS